MARKAAHRRPSARLAGVVVLGWTALLLSCRYHERQAPGGVQGAKLLKEEELSVAMTRLGQYPRRIVTSAERLPVRCYFDPQLVDLTRVRGYALWALEPDGTRWKKVATASPDALPFQFEPTEGIHGLRASVTYADGTEKLVPAPGDTPALWVCVDWSPPALAWQSPRPESAIRGRSALDLEWSSTDLQYGETPTRLEWSSDRGLTWKPIGQIAAAPGHQRYRWRLPEEVASDILVRVVARDMAGHESSTIAAFNYPGSVTTGGPAIALESEAWKAARPVAGAVAAIRPAAYTAEKAQAESLPSPTRSVEALPGMEPAPAIASPEVEWKEAPSPDGGKESTVVESDGPTPAPAPSPAIDVEPVQRPPVDVEPPALVLGAGPEVVSSELVIPVTVEDRGSGIERIEVYLKRAASEGWILVSEEKVRLGDGTPRGTGRSLLTLDLSAEEEGTYQVAVRALDRAGNASSDPPYSVADGFVGPLPEARNAPGLRVRLDRTGPAIHARPTAVDWVAGFRGEAQVRVDWTDAEPPLILEAKDASGTWEEAGRWASASPGQDLYSFVIPAGVREYTVRFTTGDAAGNRSVSEVGPRAVESPFGLTSFLATRTYPPRGGEKITWKLHPVATEIEDELRVQVSHLSGKEGEWSPLYDNLPARGESYWDLPAGDGEEHRLRLRLLRKGRVLAEEVSPPFFIGGTDAVAPTTVNIGEESLFYSEQARSLVEKHVAAARAGPEQGAVELERLAAAAVAAFQKALDLGSNNYRAAYGLAQFLNRLDPEHNAPEVKRLLLETVRIKPDHFWALNDLGAAYIREGDFQKAEAALRHSAAIEPAAIAQYNLALALFHGGKPAEARERFEAALKAGAGAVPEGDVYYYLLQTYLREGNRERAASLFRDKGAAIPEDLRSEIVAALR